MTLEQIIKAKLSALESVPQSFLDVVDAQNELLFKKILALLDELNISNGLIEVSEANLAITSQVTELLKQTLFESEYLTGLKTYIGEFGTQAGMINDIFAAQFDFSEKEIYTSLLKQSQLSTLKFLDEDAIGQAVFEPLQKDLITNIYSGGKYSDMIAGMKDYILGNDQLEPKLTSYVGRYARDSMGIFDNSYTQLISQDVNVELWEYSGGTLEDSREFCLERHEHVYTKEEIESWASEDWKGKNPNTDANTIWAYRGGYNCIHSFIPRDANFVDKSEIDTYNSI